MRIITGTVMPTIRFRTLPALVAAALLAACSAEPSSKATAASSINPESYGSFFALPTAVKTEAVAQVGRLTFTQYYEYLYAGASALPSAAGSALNPQQLVASQRASILAMGRYFPNLSALWSSLKVDPATLSLQGLTEIGASASASTGLGLLGCAQSCLDCVSSCFSDPSDDSTDTPAYRPINSQQCAEQGQKILGPRYVQQAVVVASALSQIARSPGATSADIHGSGMLIRWPKGLSPHILDDDDVARPATWLQPITGSDDYLRQCFEQVGFVLPQSS